MTSKFRVHHVVGMKRRFEVGFGDAEHHLSLFLMPLKWNLLVDATLLKTSHMLRITEDKHVITRVPGVSMVVDPTHAAIKP